MLVRTPVLVLLCQVSVCCEKGLLNRRTLDCTDCALFISLNVTGLKKTFN